MVDFTDFFKPAKKPKTTSSDVDFDAVDLSTLLPRQGRKLDQKGARKLVSGRRVLVTGAGGTIGSEIARQIAASGPASLVLLDNAEYALYRIVLELTEAGFGDIITSSLTDICRVRHLQQAFKRHQPEIVVHAAAYKHVPIVENNRCAGALTNCQGAKNVFDAAVDFNADVAVFISTDKAVNPTSFMGATKRIAELYAQALDVAQTKTNFVTVRFGNVLGSTGSVVPLFQRQIKRGGPVTVTHPDIIRFFMTTREAASLVLQAACLDNQRGPLENHDGRVFVLDMGEPMKIVDLAKKMIRAYGHEPDVDIKIEYTGLREGEKLYEEIFLDTDKLVKTNTEGVLLASPAMIDLPLLTPRLEDVIASASSADIDALDDAVNYLVPEYIVDTKARTPVSSE